MRPLMLIERVVEADVRLKTKGYAIMAQLINCILHVLRIKLAHGIIMITRRNYGRAEERA